MRGLEKSSVAKNAFSEIDLMGQAWGGSIRKYITGQTIAEARVIEMETKFKKKIHTSCSCAPKKDKFVCFACFLY
jgi:hypothetical protein